jgi:hypothetical protein
MIWINQLRFAVAHPAPLNRIVRLRSLRALPLILCIALFGQIGQAEECSNHDAYAAEVSTDHLDS